MSLSNLSSLVVVWDSETCLMTYGKRRGFFSASESLWLDPRCKPWSSFLTTEALRC